MDAPHVIDVDTESHASPGRINWLPAELRYDDDVANHEAAIVCATALDAPHVINVDTEGHASPGRVELAAG